jgi:hypothetical protein
LAPAIGSVEEYVLEAGSAMGRSDLARVAISGRQTSLTQALPYGARMLVRVRARNACGQSQPSGELLVSQF